MMLQRQLDGAFARQAGLNDDGIGTLLLHVGERGLEFLSAADSDGVDCGPGGLAATLDFFEKRLGKWIGHVDHGCHAARSEEHTSELQSLRHLVCRLLLEKKK